MATLEVLHDGRVGLSSGRGLHYVEQGDPDGYPVISHHGTPGSGKARHPDPAVYSGAHVVSYDRPGYGESDPDPGRTVASAAADVGELADALGIEQFAVTGVSGGGPHALACAALLPERVTRCGVLVGAAPPDDPELDFFAGMSHSNVVEFEAALAGEEQLADYLAPFLRAAADDPASVLDAIIDELPATDQRTFARPEMREIFRESLELALRQGSRGWIDDDVAFTKPWGFELGDVQVETRLWQGELDVLVPRTHGEYLARRLPNATFELVPGQGHFLFDEFGAVFTWLASRPG
jgi:pimeloyl-ACP methyl ester carboxylesterase